METISLIIMAVGLLALAGIYLLSRLSRRNLPQNRKLPPIQPLKDSGGQDASSIMEDHPARDGQEPSENAPDFSDVIKSEEVEPTESDKPQSSQPSQLVMFIASESEEGFTGSKILEALQNSGLTFGPMDVFHRMVLTDDGEQSLFNVANGVQPWTLIPEELQNGGGSPGLSMIMNLPTPIDNNEAVHDFVRTAERITSHLGGVLKNQDQEPITSKQRRAYFAMA